MGVITFNGVPSDVLGIKVWTFPNYETPEKEIQMIHVPGRSGDIAIDLDSYKNVERSYQVSLYDKYKSFADLSAVLSNWLHSANGYAPLYDSYEPYYYRMAIYSEGISYTNVLDQAVTATIVFNCKPQRYAFIGDEPKTITTSTILENPFSTIARPEIRVVGDGSFTINGVTTYVSGNSGTVLFIDSELQDIYYYSNGNMRNGNGRVVFSNGKFPTLNPGNNTISKASFSSMEVKPRWWTI